MSTRQTRDGRCFDHGCQYFSAKSDAFREQVGRWLTAGVVCRWDGCVVEIRDNIATVKEPASPRLVGCPTMQRICNELSRGLNVFSDTRVTDVQRCGNRWQLFTQNHVVGDFDAVVFALPPQQAASLIPSEFTLSSLCNRVRMTVCWTAMVAFETPLKTDFDAAVIHDRSLSWIARDSSKPGREPSPECWVLQASSNWSNEHREDDPDFVLEVLRNELFAVTGTFGASETYARAHRWLYAIPDAATPIVRPQFDPQYQMGICGDWITGKRVEDAWTSGLLLADTMIDL